MVAVAALVACAQAGAQDAGRFRLFPSETPTRFDGTLPDAARAQAPSPLSPADPGTVKKRPPKKFLTAASEVLLLEVGPWAFDRYVLKENFSYIDGGTIRQNFRTGWVYDHDTFQENQFLHPYHGNLFFNAARDNGYGFWEAAPFALAGSLMWECCMENTPPSINDLVNTTLGGMVRGEIAHRISAMLVDNTETGALRFVRERSAMRPDQIFRTLFTASAAPSTMPRETAPAPSTRVKKNGSSG